MDDQALITDSTLLRVRKVVVQPSERDPRELLTMDEQGDVRAFGDPTQVVARVKSRDRRTAKRGRSTISVIEWRDMPTGFRPPGE